MNVLAEPFWVPKHGNRDDEYEDAVWPQERQEYKDSCVRFAVADGATESSYARRWAGQLVQAVGEGELGPGSISEGVAPMWAEWRRWMSGLTLPWYAEEKAARGAFAALVILELAASTSDGTSGGSWCAAAIGDSCLFQVRGDAVLARFPLDSSMAFDNRPYLLGSLGYEGERLTDRFSRKEGEWVPGDIFYLMTDALACWFLRATEDGGRHPVALQDLDYAHGTTAFLAWVQSLRDAGLIRNDDSTLLRVSVR
jgi:hypothetical protein